jgi:L-histidine Nalpha-methyltransferase
MLSSCIQYLHRVPLTEIYKQITDLDEYYLTRTEHSILTANAHELVQRFCFTADRLAGSVTPVFNLVELGAGDGHKTKVVLREMLDAGLEFEYMPVDISRGAMNELFCTVFDEFYNLDKNSALRVHGVVGDYMHAVEHITAEWQDRRTVILFLGSSIGNFDSSCATVFLRSLQLRMKPRDMLLVGFDLEKDTSVLVSAYSDASGVTRDFNLNLLKRLNRELLASFDECGFEHRAVYNPVRSAMESYLISLRKQTVDIGGGTVVEFERDEAILTEYSHKYTVSKIMAMTTDAGFREVATYSDIRKWFVDVLVEVPSTNA